SQLSIDPVLGGNQQDPGARITIKQRVSGNVFVTLATDATSTQRQVIKLEYQATPRVNISGVRDQNGVMSFDVRVKKTWYALGFSIAILKILDLKTLRKNL